MTKRKPPTKFCQICGDLVPTARYKTVCDKETCRRENQRRAEQRSERRQREHNRAPGTPTIVCAVCGEILEWLAPAHLRMHGLTLVQYKQQHPDVPTIAQGVRQSRSKGLMTRAYHLKYAGKEPDSQLSEFLVGALLGDGSLENDKASVRYAEGGSNEIYLHWKYEFLTQYFHCTWKERISSPHTKSGKRYRGWWVRTASHPLLAQWRAQWYQPHKIVQKTLVERYLTPFALAVWFCDDGYAGQDRYGGAALYTMAFTMDENTWLSQMLNLKFGLTAKVVVESNTKRPFLSFTKSERQKLQSIIAPFCILGMEYKYLSHGGEEA